MIIHDYGLINALEKETAMNQRVSWQCLVVKATRFGGVVQITVNKKLKNVARKLRQANVPLFMFNYLIAGVCVGTVCIGRSRGRRAATRVLVWPKETFRLCLGQMQGWLLGWRQQRWHLMVVSWPQGRQGLGGIGVGAVRLWLQSGQASVVHL